MTFRTYRELIAERATVVVPPPRMSVSNWVDTNRVIGREYPSAFTGPWRTSRTPYLAEPMNAFDDPAVETIVLLFPSQVGKTEALLNMLMYGYGTDAGPSMWIMPTLDDVEGFSKERLVRALKTCSTLKVGSQKSRSSDDAVRQKRINGLPLTMVGSNSTSGLASRPIRRLFCDEIDVFETTKEGDPLKLATQRTQAYRRRKIVLSSTPRIRGASRIEEYYERSDKQEWFSPCPRCGELFVIRWKNIRWTSGQPETAHIEHRVHDADGKEVGGCGGVIEDNERQAMFLRSEWRATAPFNGIRGYRTWAVIAPWIRLSEIVARFLADKDRPDTLQTFVNLVLAESWEVPSQKVESASLLVRREQYKVDVPKGARVLTAGVDTQDDRLEGLVMGWGEGEESWVISRESFYGDPQEPDVWKELDEFILRAWAREAGGRTRVQCTLIDALGHRTAAVYSAVVGRQHRRFFASIGKDGGDSGQVVSSPKVLETKQGNVTRYVVDASQVKGLIHSRLKLEESHGHGVIHFPMTVGDAFFTELTAEHMVTEKNKYGVAVKKWAMRPGHSRNESLDCMGMSLAALRIICPTPARFDELARKIDAAAGVVTAGAPSGPAAPRAPRTKGWNGGL